MRLLNKYSRYILLTNLLILLLGGIVFFLLFNYIIDRNSYATLYYRKQYARTHLSRSDSLYTYQHLSPHIFSIERLSRAYDFKEQLKDTTLFDTLTNQHILFRQLTFVESIRGQPYRITVRRPLIGDIEVLRGILAAMVLLAVILTAALHYSNRIVSEKVWTPFRATLAQLRNYQLDKTTTIAFPKSDISEFNELIEVLNRLITQTQVHYDELKEYTENTTHEIQTPLAIIQSKLELLQEQNLTLEQLQLVNTANQAVSRLARLKEGLLMLVRIKNNQYTHAEPLQVASLLESRLAFFEELIQLKEIQVNTQIHAPVVVTMNPILAEIMLDNLLSNAIKYTFPNGIIQVELTTDRFVIRNTGEAPKAPPSTLFSRFAKSDSHSKSLGLGLAIVKAICNANRFQVEYVYTPTNFHEITIFFTYYRFPTDSMRKAT